MSKRPKRTDRRYDQPAFLLEDVVRLAARSFVFVEPKASEEAARFLGDDVVVIRNEIIEILKGLCMEEWRFCQLKNDEWADVYRVGVFDDWPDAWIKVKIERPKGYDAVAVISFHEWDDARET